MRGGPKLKPIVLTAEKNDQLLEWTPRRKTSQALTPRARIVPACQHDGTNREVGGQLRVTALESIKRFCMRTSDSTH